MRNISSTDQSFLDGLYKTIEDNLMNEQFGVEELARETGVSRSQLHRHIHAITDQSTSQLIREYRLKKARELLQNETATVAEVSYQVGFGSPSYFNTCFTDLYGYPPGEVKFRNPKQEKKKNVPPKKSIILVSGFIVIMIVFVLIWILNGLERQGSVSQKAEKSIAVLPFKNIRGSDENQLLCDGMMEDIINHLHHILDLNVRDRTSMEQYQNTIKTIDEIAEELGVGNILEGSVRMYNERFKISVKLIQVEAGIIWSDEFEGKLSDTIFIVQSRIAKEIALKLNASISSTEERQIRKIPTSSFAAYQKYMMGRQSIMEFWRFHDSTDLEMTEQYFRESLEIDPEFSFGYSGMADVFAQKNRYDSVIYYANKSLELDPDNAWEYIHLGWYYQNYKRDWKRALESFKKALELDPKTPYYYVDIGMLYCEELQDYVTGFSYLKKAEKLHIKHRTNSVTLYSWWARAYMHLGEYEQAEQLYKKSMIIDPMGHIMFHYSWLLGIKTSWATANSYADSVLCIIPTYSDYCNSVQYFSSFNLKHYDQALTYYQPPNSNYLNGIPHKGVVVTPRSFDSLFIAFMYQETNRYEEAKIVLNNSLRLLKKQKGTSWYISIKYAILYAIMVDRNKMLKHLSKAVDLGLRWGWQDYIMMCPVFEKYWNDPEFKSIIRRQEDKNAQVKAKIDSLEKFYVDPVIKSD